MEFSVTEASLAGFKLIGKRPLSALVWALAWIVLGYGGLAGLLYLSGVQLADSLRALPQAGDDPQAMGMAVAHFYLGFLRVFWPWMLWAWVLGIVLQAAVFRAVIEPKKRGFAYLSIGGDEVRLGLLHVIFFVLWILFCIVVGLACGAAIAGAQMLQAPWQGVAIAATIIATVVVVLVVLVRLMLAAPMTFARKRLQIFDSWGLTRGRFWALVGVVLLMAIFVVAIAFAFGLIRNAVMIGPMQDFMREAMVNPRDPSRILNRMLQVLDPRTLSPTIIAFVAVQGLADTVLRVIALAPFAESYRMLAAPPPAAPPAGGLFDAPVPAPVAPAAAAAAVAAAGHDHGHDDHGHAAPAHDDHGHAAPAHDDHGHGDAHGHDDHGHAEAHGHDDHGHGDAHGHDDHGHAEAHGHDDHGHGDSHGHDDHGHGDSHGHDDHGHGDDHGDGHGGHAHGGHH
jgi:hypothetical protein